MKKNFFLRNIIFFAIAAITLLLVYFIVVTTIPELILVIRSGNASEIQYYLKHQSTVEGLIAVGLIQFLQIWTIVISAIPLQFASGIVFDALPTFIVCSISSVLSMVIAFLVWKYLEHIVNKILPLSEKEEEMINRALSKNTTPEFILFLMSFIFVMPNGLIPIMASKTNISIKKYILSITPGVSFNVFICALEGDRLIEGDWFTVIAIIVVSTIIIAVFWKIHNKMSDKNSNPK